MRYYWLALILVLASILRLFNLSQYQAGFNPDEATFGYDAYSFWQLPANPNPNPYLHVVNYLDGSPNIMLAHD